jgi:hypothetical protein
VVVLRLVVFPELVLPVVDMIFTPTILKRNSSANPRMDNVIDVSRRPCDSIQSSKDIYRWNGCDIDRNRHPAAANVKIENMLESGMIRN